MEKKLIHKSLIALGILILVLVIFQAGIYVGYKKAGFEGREFTHDGIPGGHGVLGKVIKIDIPSLLIEGPDNSEKTILTNDQTIIRKERDSLSVQDVKVDDMIIVIGAPDGKGNILAKLIRIK